jgi:hypothetical protein
MMLLVVLSTKIEHGPACTLLSSIHKKLIENRNLLKYSTNSRMKDIMNY